jgi:hypothetical protein
MPSIASADMRDIEYLVDPAVRSRAVVEHLRRAQADQPHDAAQEQVDLVVLAQDFDRAAAHQPVVGVVVDDVDTEAAHQTVEGGGGHALQARVAGALRPHAVDDVMPCW